MSVRVLIKSVLSLQVPRHKLGINLAPRTYHHTTDSTSLVLVRMPTSFAFCFKE